MIVGAVCLSHSPLVGRARPAPPIEAGFETALAKARERVEAMAPDFAIIFFPDHLNGFHYRCLPSFCIGARATSLGDFSTTPGEIAVRESDALAMTEHVLQEGVDTALSFDMLVDHGAAQPLEGLGLATLPVVPVFINCAAVPRAPFLRSRALGTAVGGWAERDPRRVLVIGSGGLSHDPPLPKIADADVATKQRLIKGASLTFGERVRREQNVLNAARTFAAGVSALTPLNTGWDRSFLAALERGDVTVADSWSDHDVTRAAGCGGHEVRTWIAAMAALAEAGPYRAERHFYEPVPEWLTGMGILSAWPEGDRGDV